MDQYSQTVSKDCHHIRWLQPFPFPYISFPTIAPGHLFGLLVSWHLGFKCLSTRCIQREGRSTRIGAISEICIILSPECRLPLTVRLNQAAHNVRSEPGSFTETTTEKKTSTGTEVSDYHFESSVQDEWFSCSRDHRLGEKRAWTRAEFDYTRRNQNQ